MTAVHADDAAGFPTFRDLGLSEAVLRGLEAVGYESPSPIQAATIPVLLSGADMLGQAQTGTGKTAAFALPALSRLDLPRTRSPGAGARADPRAGPAGGGGVSALCRASQGFHVLPIYGGQSYQPQLNALRRGVHVVVGTPGRVIDHMNRGTLNLARLTMLVLDEADEMLRMGFIDAVESILEQTPQGRQVALFSATLAPRRSAASRSGICARRSKSPSRARPAPRPRIRQRYWMVSGHAQA